MNGAGKTTLVSREDVRRVIGGLSLLNPDQIAEAIRLEHPSLDVNAANLEAARRVEASAYDAVARGESVLVETVLSTTKYGTALRFARELGFRVGMIYVGLPDVRYSILRVRERVEAGGHDVPVDKLHSRWERSHDNLARFLPLVDDLFVFSNAGLTPVLVAVKLGGGPARLLLPDALPDVTKRLRQ